MAEIFNAQQLLKHLAPGLPADVTLTATRNGIKVTTPHRRPNVICYPYHIESGDAWDEFAARIRQEWQFQLLQPR